MDKKTKIRYKYRPSEKGFELDKVKCPVCGNPINSTEIANSYDWNRVVILLAECWSGTTEKDLPKHLFLIRLDGLPMVDVTKVKRK